MILKTIEAFDGGEQNTSLLPLSKQTGLPRSISLDLSDGTTCEKLLTMSPSSNTKDYRPFK